MQITLPDDFPRLNAAGWGVWELRELGCALGFAVNSGAWVSSLKCLSHGVLPGEMKVLDLMVCRISSGSLHLVSDTVLLFVCLVHLIFPSRCHNYIIDVAMDTAKWEDSVILEGEWRGGGRAAKGPRDKLLVISAHFSINSWFWPLTNEIPR